jgi:hypothetical protein
LETEAEENVGAVSFDPPVDDYYLHAMYGYDALMSVATSIENGEVMSSVKQQPMYKTLPGGQAYHTRLWWYNWQDTVEQKRIGEGGYNTAYLVSAPYVDLDPGPQLFTMGFDTTAPANGMIIRIGREATRKWDVIQEMITAAYAHANGFGPVIYAQFYYTTDQDIEADLKRDPPTPKDWAAKVPPFKTLANDKPDLNTEVDFTCTIAEAWEGDCHDKMTMQGGDSNFDPDKFAPVFVNLVVKAANAGFWHMDIKRANLLYRSGKSGNLELCFTDFDSRFCSILPPERRANTRICCIVATVACFLGEIRCTDSLVAWQTYMPALKSALNNSLGVDVDTIGPEQWCFFLRAVGETRPFLNTLSNVIKQLPTRIMGGVRKADSKSKSAVQIKLRTQPCNEDPPSPEEEVIGFRFRQHIKQYFYPRDGDDIHQSCFTPKKGKPLFAQIVKWALTQPE